MAIVSADIGHTTAITPVEPFDGPIPRGLSICFYPHRVHARSFYRYLLGYLDWRATTNPDNATWRMLYDTDTWVRLDPADPHAHASWTWLNGRCRDISKRTVQQVFERVFGYPLAVDPVTTSGPIVSKNDLNAVKDLRIVHGPLPPEQVRADLVYERLIDTRVAELGLIEFRLFMIAGRVVTARRKIEQDWHASGRLDNPMLDRISVVPASEFSPDELDRIAVFCHEVGLDVGALDVMRDRADGRVYVLDVTKTPGGQPIAPRYLVEERHLAQAWARALLEHYPPASGTGMAIG
jgi:hypothetical protein